MKDETETRTEDRANFDWQECWYPATFAEDLPADRPVRVTLWDLGIVLFRDGDGQINALRDLCPHRAARLSDGQLRDGRLECLYHGWQFDGAGDCQFIPQMVPGRDYPIRSCVRQFPVQITDGIVWIWNGAADRADPAKIPPSQSRGVAGIHAVTFQMDLPYDQSYLIENVIDIAHIHIAHDGMRGGGLREAAKPLDFTIEHDGPEGIRATFRSIGLERAEGAPDIAGALVEFVAPNLIRYSSRYARSDLVAGLELYALPAGKGRCRLLYRKYANFTGWRERIKPRWLEHQTQCLILEQDMNVVVGQHEEIEAADKPLRELWLPIKTSDRLVVAYRRWLDRYGAALPFFRGFGESRDSAPAQDRRPQDRSTLHTAICPTCRRVARRLDHGSAFAGVAALLSLAVAATMSSGGWALTFLLLAFVAIQCRLLRRRF